MRRGCNGILNRDLTGVAAERLPEVSYGLFRLLRELLRETQLLLGDLLEDSQSFPGHDLGADGRKVLVIVRKLELFRLLKKICLLVIWRYNLNIDEGLCNILNLDAGEVLFIKAFVTGEALVK